jgi:serine/threonine protein kinase
MTVGIRASDISRVIHRAAADDPDLKAHPPVAVAKAGRELADTLLCTPGDAPKPAKIFDRLRWGGQVVFVSDSGDEAVRIGSRLSESGFEITHKPSHINRGWLGLPIPFLSRKVHFLVARKVALILPGHTTDRFTFHVHLLCNSSGEYEVVKEVPTLEMVMARLRSKWPDLADEVVEKRARKFTDKIFPVFLTREAAILKIVNRDLPEKYRDRVPRLIEMDKDDRGFAKRLHLSWLRNGGEPLSQLEFALQSADLLRALHDDAGIMHLDLRLDNFVITPDGVGFVDFGSAVRVDENLKQSPLLSSLFEELMRTSEIQRMLFRMTRTGEVTSEAISGGLHKVDKAVDCFYLAVQISSPHANPDLKDLIRFDKGSDDAGRLSRLTEQILRPTDPAKPAFRSAADILKGIRQLKQAQANGESKPQPTPQTTPAILSKTARPT